jgi:hypothetical protein
VRFVTHSCIHTLLALYKALDHKYILIGINIRPYKPYTLHILYIHYAHISR